jgi:hypothetical protein
MTFTATPIHSFLTTDGQDIPLFPVSPVPSEVTVAEAAKVLRTSEKHLNNLLSAGHIASRQENGECLVRQDSLIEFAQKRERTLAALDEMVRWDQEMELYND